MKKLLLASFTLIGIYTNAQYTKYYDITVRNTENLGTEEAIKEKIERNKQTLYLYLDNLKAERVNALNRLEATILQLIKCRPLDNSAEFTRLRNLTDKITDLKKEVDKLTINNTIIQQTVKLVDDEIIYSTEMGRLKYLQNECLK